MQDVNGLSLEHNLEMWYCS